LTNEKKLSDKDWIYSTVSHKETERVPYHFDFTPPARKKIADHYGSDDIENTLSLPIRWGGTHTAKPLYADTDTYGEQAVDEFGVTWSVSDMDRGAPIIPGITKPDLSGYNFPDPNADYRFEDIDTWCDENKDHFRLLWIGELWERATFIRSMEELLLDLTINKKFVFELLEGITDYIIKTMKILMERYDFEAFSLSDDYGTQKALQMSPGDWQKFIKPFLGQIFELARENGKIMMVHTCGNVFEVIGDMIDIGLDILHPIQPETMDIYKLKAEFGRELTFQGGLGTQNFLPRATPDKIRDEVKILKNKMGMGGGYILEPGITIQGDIPVDNLLAMIEEAKKTG
jgi:uroporphyrinogen decarboxylase